MEEVVSERGFKELMKAQSPQSLVLFYWFLFLEYHIHICITPLSDLGLVKIFFQCVAVCFAY